jgi:hypothetical protein
MFASGNFNIRIIFEVNIKTFVVRRYNSAPYQQLMFVYQVYPDISNHTTLQLIIASNYSLLDDTLLPVVVS